MQIARARERHRQQRAASARRQAVPYSVHTTRLDARPEDTAEQDVVCCANSPPINFALDLLTARAACTRRAAHAAKSANPRSLAQPYPHHPIAWTRAWAHAARAIRGCADEARAQPRSCRRDSALVTLQPCVCRHKPRVPCAARQARATALAGALRLRGLG